MFCSIENAIQQYDHGFLMIFLMLLIANMRMISRNCRYQNREHKAEVLRSLDCRVGCLRHPALRVPDRSNECVVRSCHRCRSTVMSKRFDTEGSRLVFGMPVLEAGICGDGPQVVRR